MENISVRLAYNGKALAVVAILAEASGPCGQCSVTRCVRNGIHTPKMIKLLTNKINFMKVEEIPSNEIVIMNPDMHRLFNAGGCDPMCHCCFRSLKVNEKFKLSTITELIIQEESPLDYISTKLKLEQRKGKVITEKDLWKAHKIEMGYSYDYRKHGMGIHEPNRENIKVSYEEYISHIKEKSNLFKHPHYKDKVSVFDSSNEEKWIEIRDRFFNDVTKEVMLCENCTPDEFSKREKDGFSENIREYEKPKKGGCFRINGKIVH
jgi:hypothetical protein